jgi:hypothetical protein
LDSGAAPPVPLRHGRLRAARAGGSSPTVTTAGRFVPETIFAALNDAGVRYVVIGGLAATLHGSPLRTGDADICPSRDSEDLSRLAAALVQLEARIRVDRGEPISAPLSGSLLATAETWNLTTNAGELDIAFVPAGTDGYDDLAPHAARFELEDGTVVDVASLEDVIRSKRAADRVKDREALPVLEAVLRERDRQQ